MPELARVDGLTVVFILAVLGLAVVARLLSQPETVVRDSQGNPIDPAALESDEPPEIAEMAATQARTRRWMRLRTYRSGVPFLNWWGRQ